jgi:hypothetical protein
MHGGTSGRIQNSNHESLFSALILATVSRTHILELRLKCGSKIKTAGTNTSRGKTWQHPKLPTETYLSYLLPAFFFNSLFGQQHQQPSHGQNNQQPTTTTTDNSFHPFPSLWKEIINFLALSFNNDSVQRNETTPT